MTNKIKSILHVTLFLILVLIFIILVIFTRESDRIIDIKDFIVSGEKILYIKDNLENKYLIELFKKYDLEYFEVDIKELNLFERKELKNILNNNDLHNKIVVFKDGVIKTTLSEFENAELINEFLKDYYIIPEDTIDDIDSIINNIYSIYENEYSMVYIPYINHNDIDEQDEIFSKISKKYNVAYERIDAYYLSNSQKNKINNFLGISEVENQILILVKNNKMIANIRGVHGKNTYIETLYDLNFVDELEIKINKIEYEELKRKVDSNEKNIILFGIDNSKDSKNIYELLNQMIYTYGISVNYIDLISSDSEIYKNIAEYLEELEYNDGFSLPLVLITESNHILDYVIGNSNEEYFLDVFMKNGVIKGEIINE